MKVSIIIVTYNSAEDIKACLGSIRCSSDFETIVIDNASRDKTREILLSYSAPHLKLILNEKNLGYACANNQGAAASQGEYLLFLNPDTIIRDDALDRMVEFLDKNPLVAAVAPRLLNPDGTKQLSIRSFPTFSSVLWEMTGLPRIFPKFKKIGKWRLRYFDYDKFQYVEQPMASCLLIRRTVFTELGGFDETFPIFYNDVDLSYRLYQKGGRTAYLPEARVYHKLGASTGQIKPKMVYEAHRSLFRFLKKYNTGAPFFLKAVVLLPLLEISALIRVINWQLHNRLFRRSASHSA
ncbi:MAG: glycosyltransferase family 2 protein [candidate division WOR-3 bacterium]